MEPLRKGDAGGRAVRAYGIYPNASFFNHDCLPNACRFDYLDRDGDGNTNITIRAIKSYFPANWGYDERQQRLMEDYGFHCSCDRCEVEMNWKEDEDERVEEMEGENCEDAGDEDGDADFPMLISLLDMYVIRRTVEGQWLPCRHYRRALHLACWSAMCVVG